MTNREIQLAITMTKRITLLTEQQAQTHGLLATAESLCRRQLLCRRVLVFRPIQPGAQPLTVHRPGEPFTYEDACELARQALARMLRVAPVALTVYQARAKAYAIWGDEARKKGNPFCFGHDHLLSAVFWQLAPSERGQWQYEPVPVTGAVQFEKVPDAAIVASNGEPLRFHEAVGSYPASRLLALAAQSSEKLAHRVRNDQAGANHAGATGIYFW